MKRWVLLGTLGVLLVSVVPAALACQICLGASFVPTGQQLEIADQAVLAVPVAKGRQFRIVEVAKGNAAVDQLITEPVLGADAAIRQGQALLLLRHDLWPQWSSLGAIGVVYAGWLRQLAEWEYWDATPEYVALLKSNVVQDPASRYAIVNYLQRSPRADAKAARESLPVADRSLPVVPVEVK